MTDVLFYDFDFNLLGIFPRIISFNLTKNFCGYGTAELHLSLKETDVISLLEDNEYLFFVSNEYSAIVTGWRIGEDIAIFGRTPEWLLTKRGVKSIEKTSETPEVIARDAVMSAAGDFITLGELAGVDEVQDYSTDKVRVLHDVVCEVLKPQNLGFEVKADISQKKFIFSVYSGKDALCLISPSNRTAYDMTYTVEKQDMVTNSGWYEQKLTDMGEWNASENSPALYNGQESNAYTFYNIVSSYSRFDLDCQEGEYLYSDNKNGIWRVSSIKPENIWIYLNNSLEEGARKWDAVISGTKTEDEALAEISQRKRQDKTESETKGIEYGVDYCLGDTVRVQMEFGKFKKSERKRVTSVIIYYDIDKAGVTPELSSLEE